VPSGHALLAGMEEARDLQGRVRVKVRAAGPVSTSRYRSMLGRVISATDTPGRRAFARSRRLIVGD
jgi:hypothetical protein